MSMTTFCIGLIGGIASGKSTAATYFESCGLPTVDTDKIARMLTEPGTPMLEDIVAHFGKTILLRSGKLNRKKLSQIIFKNSAERQILENLLHPEIYQTLNNSICNSTHSHILIMLPLFTWQTKKYCPYLKRICCVIASQSLRMQRIKQRDGLPEKQIHAIMAAQPKESEQIGVSDDIIVNTGSAIQLKQQVAIFSNLYKNISPCSFYHHYK